ncbi:MAG: hypothetical protein ABUL62_02540 [Myxococcales bacterium]
MADPSRLVDEHAHGFRDEPSTEYHCENAATRHDKSQAKRRVHDARFHVPLTLVEGFTDQQGSGTIPAMQREGREQSAADVSLQLDPCESAVGLGLGDPVSIRIGLTQPDQPIAFAGCAARNIEQVPCRGLTLKLPRFAQIRRECAADEAVVPSHISIEFGGLMLDSQHATGGQ